MRPLLLALVAAPLALAQVSKPEPANLSLEGTVTDTISGAPLAGVRMVLSAMGVGHTLTYSDAAGHFQFDGLRDGIENLTASRTGYLQASQVVALKSGENPTPVRIALTPQAVIAGSVEDQDGFPVASASIIVLTRSAKGELVSAVQSGITTDDRGNFRAAGLAHGSYYLHVEPGMARNWDSRYRDVYYPGASQFEDAEAIEVATGQVRPGIVVRLQMSGGVRVEGRVVLPAGVTVQQGGARAQVTLSTVGLPGFGRTTYFPLADDGSFTLKDVQPGRYHLEPTLPPPYSRGFTAGPGGVLEANLEVGSSDVTGIVLHVEDIKPVDLAGRVVFEPGTTPGPAIILLMQNHAVQGQTASLEEGSFQLRNIPPGKYRISATTVGGGARGVSARLGGADVPYGDLELKGDNPGKLEITMSSASVRVEGVIVGGAAKYALFLAIKPGLQPVALGTADAAGHFAVELRPGEYRVWPAAEVPANFWDGNVEAHGQLVTIVAGENPPLRLALPAGR